VGSSFCGKKWADVVVAYPQAWQLADADQDDDDDSSDEAGDSPDLALEPAPKGDSKAGVSVIDAFLHFISVGAHLQAQHNFPAVLLILLSIPQTTFDFYAPENSRKLAAAFWAGPTNQPMLDSLYEVLVVLLRKTDEDAADLVREQADVLATEFIRPDLRVKLQAAPLVAFVDKLGSISPGEIIVALCFQLNVSRLAWPSGIQLRKQDGRAAAGAGRVPAQARRHNPGELDAAPDREDAPLGASCLEYAIFSC
jgi:hypothetical protein